MLRFKKLGVTLLLLVVISCSIVKDSDVTSLSQLSQLKLASISIGQDLSSTSNTQLAKVTDSIYASPVSATIDINDKINGSIVKQTIITWPTFVKTKLLFRSKISSTGIVIRNSFYQNGSPRSCTVYQNNQLKEWYSFYYDNSWKLTNIRSRVYSSIPAADTVIYRDSLVYNSSGYVSSLVRKSPTTPSKVATLSFSYTTYGSGFGLGGSSVTYSGYNYSYGNCNCPDNSNNTCSGADLSTTSGGGLSARFIATAMQISNVVTQLKIDDIKSVNGSNGCGGNGGFSDYDIYYFHPLMFLRGFFVHGDILLEIYAIDWWQPGAQIGSAPSKNEEVTFNFNYVR